MPVPTQISDLSVTIASNSPAGSESAAATDDYLRAHAGFIAQLYAATSGNAGASFTPTDGSTAGLTFTSPSGYAYKIGKLVFFRLALTYPTTVSTAAAKITDLPYTSANANQPVSFTRATANASQATVLASTKTVAILTDAGGATTNANLSGTSITVAGWYEASA